MIARLPDEGTSSIEVTGLGLGPFTGIIIGAPAAGLGMYSFSLAERKEGQPNDHFVRYMLYPEMRPDNRAICATELL